MGIQAPWREIRVLLLLAWMELAYVGLEVLEWKSISQSCKVKYLTQPNPCETTILAWSVRIPELHVEKGINEEENPTGELFMLTCFGVAVYCRISAFSPLSPHFSPIPFLGNKVKEFCCGQVWKLSGSSAVVSIPEEAVMEGDRALRSLGGEMAAEVTALWNCLLSWNRCQHHGAGNAWKFHCSRHSWGGKRSLQKGIFTQLWSACVVLNVLQSPW